MDSKPRQIFIAGSAQLDIISTMQEQNLVNGYQAFGKTVFGFGGVAYNTAVNLRSLDVDVTLMTAMNNSPMSQMLRAQMAQYGVRSHILVDEDLPESVYNGHFFEGEEINFVCSNTDQLVTFDEKFIRKGMKGASSAIINCSLNVESLNNCVDIANKLDIPVFMAGVGDAMAKRIKMIEGQLECVFLNTSEMVSLVTEFDGLSWQEVVNHFNAKFIVTRGAEGVSYLRPNDEEIRYHLQAEKEKGTALGAGDLFLSYTVKEHIMNYKRWRDAIQVAIDNAPKVLERDDANMGSADPLAESITRIVDTAHVDQLTGALNRHGIERFFTTPNMSMADMHALLIDADFFKQINDNHGHKAGDEVLVSIVNIVKENLRNGDMVGRFGGEEFICFLQRIPTKEAVKIANRIRKHIESVKHSEESLDVTVSIGVSKWQKEDTVESIMHRADGALYEAKENGRNQVVVAAE